MSAEVLAVSALVLSTVALVIAVYAARQRPPVDRILESLAPLPPREEAPNPMADPTDAPPKVGNVVRLRLKRRR